MLFIEHQKSSLIRSHRATQGAPAWKSALARCPAKSVRCFGSQGLQEMGTLQQLVACPGAWEGTFLPSGYGDGDSVLLKSSLNRLEFGVF
jgi:hypothetical protein